jgi:hypothetical protein
MALDWLHDLIENKVGGGLEASCEVFKFVHATLIKNN